jgi:hypothetical protein
LYDILKIVFKAEREILGLEGEDSKKKFKESKWRF